MKRAAQPHEVRMGFALSHAGNEWSAPTPVCLWSRARKRSSTAQTLINFFLPPPLPAALVDRLGVDSQIAMSYVFLASNTMSSYMSGQILHPNGGVVVHG